MRKKRHSFGFTLIELLVAMTIVAILSGLALVSYQGARQSARDGKRKADLEEIRSALEMYRADEGSYPSDLATLESAGYIDLPTDPLAGRSYSYHQVSASTYKLCAALEIDTGESYVDCGGDCGVGCNYQVKNP